MIIELDPRQAYVVQQALKVFLNTCYDNPNPLPLGNLPGGIEPEDVQELVLSARKAIKSALVSEVLRTTPPEMLYTGKKRYELTIPIGGPDVFTDS